MCDFHDMQGYCGRCKRPVPIENLDPVTFTCRECRAAESRAALARVTPWALFVSAADLVV